MPGRVSAVAVMRLLHAFCREGVVKKADFSGCRECKFSEMGRFVDTQPHPDTIKKGPRQTLASRHLPQARWQPHRRRSVADPWTERCSFSKDAPTASGRTARDGEDVVAFLSTVIRESGACQVVACVRPFKRPIDPTVATERLSGQVVESRRRPPLTNQTKLSPPSKLAVTMGVLGRCSIDRPATCQLQ
jgi:hypothetical protein